MHVFTVNNKKKLIMMLLVCIALVLVLLVLKNHKEIVKEYFNHDPELKKAYLLITGDWFLSSQLSDFSQVLTTEAFYVVPWDEAGIPKDMDYSVYAYPTRPDLVGLDAGGLYTLKELQGRLAAAYSN